MVLLNIISLLKYIDEFRVFFVVSIIDILVINEMRFDFLIYDNEVYILGYEIVCCDRLFNGCFGGGVCFYICNCINYLICFDLCID